MLINDYLTLFGHPAKVKGQIHNLSGFGGSDDVAHYSPARKSRHVPTPSFLVSDRSKVNDANGSQDDCPNTVEGASGRSEVDDANGSQDDCPNSVERASGCTPKHS